MEKSRDAFLDQVQKLLLDHLKAVDELMRDENAFTCAALTNLRRDLLSESVEIIRDASDDKTDMAVTKGLLDMISNIAKAHSTSARLALADRVRRCAIEIERLPVKQHES